MSVYLCMFNLGAYLVVFACIFLFMFMAMYLILIYNVRYMYYTVLCNYVSFTCFIMFFVLLCFFVLFVFLFYVYILGGLFMRILIRVFLHSLLFICLLFSIYLCIDYLRDSFNTNQVVLNYNAPPATNYLEVLAKTRQKKEDLESDLHYFITKYSSYLPNDLLLIIYLESLKYGFDPNLIMAQIHVESSFRYNAVSSMGAIGLMQIMPATGKSIAKDLGYSSYNLFDPVTNIKFGIYYMHKLHKRFGDYDIALSAYFWGPTNVSKNIDKYRSTEYSRKVRDRINMF